MSLPDSSSASSHSQRTSIASDILMYVPNYAVPNSPLQGDDDCLNVTLQVKSNPKRKKKRNRVINVVSFNILSLSSPFK